jgi:hypothetical protein
MGYDSNAADVAYSTSYITELKVVSETSLLLREWSKGKPRYS